MGYELICGIPIAVGADLAIVFGLFIMLARLEDWAAKRINRNRAGQGLLENLKNFFPRAKAHQLTREQATYPHHATRQHPEQTTASPTSQPGAGS